MDTGDVRETIQALTEAKYAEENRSEWESILFHHKEMRLSHRVDPTEEPDLFLKVLPTYILLRPKWASNLGLNDRVICHGRFIMWVMGRGDTEKMGLDEIPDAPSLEDIEGTFHLSEDFVHEYRSISGETLLHLAIATGHMPAIEWLVYSYPGLLARLDKFNASPLRYAQDLQLPSLRDVAHVIGKTLSTSDPSSDSDPDIDLQSIAKEVICLDVVFDEGRGLKYLSDQRSAIEGVAVTEKDFRTLESSVRFPEDGQRRIAAYLHP